MDVYPYDESFQYKLLAVMLKDPNFLPSYSDIVNPNYFDDENSSIIARIALDYYSEFGRIPGEDVIRTYVSDYVRDTKVDSSTRDDLSKVVQFVYDLSIDDSTYVSSRAIEFGRHKNLKSLTMKVGQLLDQGAKADEIWRLYDTARQNGSGSSVEFKDLGKGLVNASRVIRESTLYSPGLKISTGIPTLDRLMNGGLGRKELGAILGFANLGKSLTLVNLACAALIQRVPVVHISVGEMEYEDLLARYGARLTGIRADDITSNEDIDSTYESSIRDVVSRIEPEVYFKYIPAWSSVSQIRSVLSRIKFRDKIDPALVIIDNGDELASSRSFRDSYEEQGAVYTELKQMAHDFDVGIWVDTQTNRHGGSKLIASMEDMGESHRKSKKLDVLISINQTYPDEYEKGVMRLVLVKGRRYRKSVEVCWCKVDRERMTIKELAQSEAMGK